MRVLAGIYKAMPIDCIIIDWITQSGLATGRLLSEANRIWLSHHMLWWLHVEMSSICRYIGQWQNGNRTIMVQSSLPEYRSRG